jgi:hypothetical protein
MLVQKRKLSINAKKAAMLEAAALEVLEELVPQEEKNKEQ